MFKNKVITVFILAMVGLIFTPFVQAQEHTISSDNTSSQLDVQTRGLNELIRKVDTEIQNVTNCASSQQFFTGSGCEYLNESEPLTNNAAKAPMITCSNSNELAKWNGTNWFCESITIPNDCSGNAQLSECSTSSLSLQDGQTQSGVTCEGTYGQCSADVTCNGGSYTVSNEYCPPIPVNCYDNVGGAGCSTMHNLSHGQSGNWTCDTGYTGECSAVCNAGNFQGNTNTCTGAGTWTPNAWSTCSNTCGTGTQTRSYTCVGGVCTTPQPANDSQSCTDYSTCGYTWQSGTWGTCSVTCGSGTQTRTVSCKRNDGVTVSSTYCSGTKPATSKSCSTTSGCTAVNCQGSWSSWTGHTGTCYMAPPSNCGVAGYNTRQRTYTITQPAQYGGTSCVYSDGQTQSQKCWYCITCFQAETLITMSNGYLKPISEIEVGDKVKAPNGIINTVQEVLISDYQGEIFSINSSDSFVTGGHPFKTTEGWKAFNVSQAKAVNPEIDIKQLAIDDILILETGKVKLQSYSSEFKDKMKVYNINLDGTKEYYADGFLVHNK